MLLSAGPPLGSGVLPRTGLRVGSKSCSRSPSGLPSCRPPVADAPGADARSPPPMATAGTSLVAPSESTQRERTARLCTPGMGRASPGTSSARLPETPAFASSGVSASGDRNAPDLAPGEDAGPASHDPCGVSQGESRYGESRSHWSSGFSAEGADASARAGDPPFGHAQGLFSPGTSRPGGGGNSTSKPLQRLPDVCLGSSSLLWPSGGTSMAGGERRAAPSRSAPSPPPAGLGVTTTADSHPSGVSDLRRGSPSPCAGGALAAPAVGATALSPPPHPKSPAPRPPPQPPPPQGRAPPARLPRARQRAPRAPGGPPPRPAPGPRGPPREPRLRRLPPPFRAPDPPSPAPPRGAGAAPPPPAARAPARPAPPPPPRPPPRPRPRGPPRGPPPPPP